MQLFDGIRNRFLAGEPVLDRRRPNGRPLTNYFSPRSPSPRQYIGDALVPILRPGLSQDFLLGIKDNAAFTSMIPAILERPGFRVLAVVRDPVATLLSQQSVDLPIAQGLARATVCCGRDTFTSTDARPDIARTKHPER